MQDHEEQLSQMMLVKFKIQIEKNQILHAILKQSRYNCILQQILVCSKNKRYLESSLRSHKRGLVRVFVCIIALLEMQKEIKFRSIWPRFLSKYWNQCRFDCVVYFNLHWFSISREWYIVRRNIFSCMRGQKICHKCLFTDRYRGLHQLLAQERTQRGT